MSMPSWCPKNPHQWCQQHSTQVKNKKTYEVIVQVFESCDPVSDMYTLLKDFVHELIFLNPLVACLVVFILKSVFLLMIS